jgi:protein-S-isoprenylcysteine O-methyltransferase Ste14
MNAWINLFVLVMSSLLFLLFYIRSVRPATLEKVMGEKAYDYCGKMRVIAVVFEAITGISYMVYYFLPVQFPLPQKFPWPWWISIVIAVVIVVPTSWLMLKGLMDAGSEAIRPRKENVMYGGIYEKMRHPQALGEMFAWMAIGFGLHSPFLVLFSFVYFPIFVIMCFAEEQDLLWRFGEGYAEYMKQVGMFGRKK